MRSASVRGIGLGCVLVSVLSLSAIVTAAEVQPWFKPGNEENYVFVGKQVWEVDSGKDVAPEGASKVWLGREVRRIVGVDDRVFAPGGSKEHIPPGTAPRGVIQPLDYSQLEPVT